MKNITYLIGAGASAGKRWRDMPEGDPKDNRIYEGLPCVNEISDCLWNITSLIDLTPIPNDLTWMDPQIGLASVADWEEARKNLSQRLHRLHVFCEQNATIDTYAKKLVLKKRQDKFKELEQLLALFFIYLQLQNYPDTRYDTFLANILESNLHFPQNIRVISWNYDSQFEIAYSEYDEQGELLVGSKNAKFDTDYEIIKINGTATFDNQISIATLRKEIWEKIWAIKDEPNHSEQLQRDQTWVLYFVYLYQLYMVGKKDNTHLSFAFDSSEPSEKILNSIDKIISKTDALVVMGYTFPFFNREIDRKILKNLNPNAKIYIQDKYPKRIIQNFKAVKADILEEQIEPKEETDQFFLPPEL
ncbi:MAG: hypothetical protein IKO26_03060 [Paludibacteraceae bacterium]|nr:hypothetical protein [Paludibacteraceae bacterium]